MSFGQHPKAAHFHDLPPTVQAAFMVAPLEIAVWMGADVQHIRDRLAALRYKFQNLSLLDQALQAAQDQDIPVAPLPDDVLASRLQTALDQAGPYLSDLTYRAFKLLWVEMAEGVAGRWRTQIQDQRLQTLVAMIKAEDLIAPRDQMGQYLQQHKA